MANEQRGDNDGEGEEQVGLVADGPLIEGVDIGAGRVSEAAPHPDPQDRSEGVEGQEGASGHVAGTGEDAVGLAQTVNELIPS